MRGGSVVGTQLLVELDGLQRNGMRKAQGAAKSGLQVEDALSAPWVLKFL